ncbi:MAG: aldehyde dehydrogenase family protein [Azospirillaceae bacterium]
MAAQSHITFDRLDPISERVATRAASAGPEDALEAANAAAAAFPAWSATTPADRAGILTEAAALLEARADAFVAAMAEEIGSSERWARFNCQLAGEMLRQAATLCGYETRIAVDGGRDDIASYQLRQPVGVVLGIAPWNAPVVLGTRAVAAPLACGNTTVLKASELCPKTHSLIVESLNDAGLPPGAVNLVTHAPEHAGEIVEALVGHDAVRRVNFTGSTRVGRTVAEICARHLKPCLLELSGKAPLLVLADADVEAAVEAAAFGAFFNQGQICISTERLVVDAAVADDFVAAFARKAASLHAGDPRTGDFPLGSMIGMPAVRRIKGLIDDAVAKGATLVTGGTFDNTIMQPTVLDHVHSGMRVYHEESFGPVAAVIRVAGEAEAISVANNTEYGLAAAVFSRDVARAERVARQLETGICHINGPTLYDDPRMPFGGMKASGYGRFGGEAGVHEFTELRWMSIQQGPRDYPI